MGIVIKFPKKLREKGGKKKLISSEATVYDFNEIQEFSKSTFARFKYCLENQNLEEASYSLHLLFNLSEEDSSNCAAVFHEKYTNDISIIEVLEEIETHMIVSKPNKTLWLLSNYFGLNGANLVLVWQNLYVRIASSKK